MDRRPRLALPFTVLHDPGVVRLVAGEDFRYTLTAPNLDEWLPALLSQCDGRLSVDELLTSFTEPRKSQARELIERLYGERVLVDGTASNAHRALCCPVVFEGENTATPGSPTLYVLRQDRLDLDEALRFNRRMRAGHDPWLWVSTGAMNCGYVSPVFLPDAGPCLGCLLRHFRMLSPVPEIHDALIEHGRRQRPFAPAAFPEEANAVLAQLVQWKSQLLAEADPPAQLYRLHVLEVDTMEVTSHRVFIDPECPECGRGV